MGTPDFAVPCFKKFLSGKHEIVAVVTVPDKPAGRGHKLTASAVKRAALDAGLPVLQPEKLKDPGFISALKSFNADLFVVVAFRILPEDVFSLPPAGTINLHASLLPRYRGAAPINWALINGESKTGVSTFFIEKNIDTGHLLLQDTVPISPDMNAGELHDTLSIVGAELLYQTVEGVANHSLRAFPQKGEVTLAPKLSKELCLIDWSNTAVNIHNLVRGLSPFPSAFTFFNGKMLKILKTKIVSQDQVNKNNIGKIIRCDKKGPFYIQTGKGLISIMEVKPEGKRTMTIAEFLRGYPVNVFDCFSGA
ncbi:methionyl-tRNA formyltransferase [candidate division KSB1 bacterium]|nr:methionyl-tRNA formyltransferase [candidate division KSB1 bacterium]